jgi:hypothetical protein
MLQEWTETQKLPISPLAGEMAGRPEGGGKDRHGTAFAVAAQKRSRHLSDCRFLPRPWLDPGEKPVLETILEGMPMTMSQTASVSSPALWTGRVLSGLIVLFMIFDGVIKLPPLDVVTQAMAPLGWPADPGVARMLGIIGLISTALYALPRTSVLGAILLTAYMGGAIATNVRVGNPLFSHTLFGVYLGLILWAGLYLRDPRVRALIPSSR